VVTFSAYSTPIPTPNPQLRKSSTLRRDYTQFVAVKGNLATAESEAFGKNSSTQVFTTVVKGKFSASTGFSAALAYNSNSSNLLAIGISRAAEKIITIW
jgi:hypothetical protein